ncbi:MAG: hypothetical protein AB8G14_11325 [Ilumatobacter sp.]
MTEVFELIAGDANDSVRVMVSSLGGRVTRILVSRADVETDVLAQVPDAHPRSTSWGSYPMAPWAGRIRHGRFEFLGEQIHLDLNHQDGAGAGGGPLHPHHRAPTGEIGPEDRHRHAIHGTTLTRTWTIDSSSERHVEMSCELTGTMGWPFSGVARQRIDVRTTGVDFAMSVESSNGSFFPAAIGWHPCFAPTDQLDFAPIAMYEQDDIGLPTGLLVTPPSGPWDDCFINHSPIRLHYDRPVAPTVTVTSPTDHWVIYNRSTEITCVEPQTGPPDAVNVRPEVVASDRPLRHTMSIDWE